MDAAQYVKIQKDICANNELFAELVHTQIKTASIVVTLQSIVMNSVMASMSGELGEGDMEEAFQEGLREGMNKSMEAARKALQAITKDDILSMIELDSSGQNN